MGIPEMRKRGYPDGVAAGSIAAGGTLGILIPPSVTMIVYGIATETSIGRLFLSRGNPWFVTGDFIYGMVSIFNMEVRQYCTVESSRSYTWQEERLKFCLA